MGLFLLSACGSDDDGKGLSDAEFRQLYTDIIYIGELHRGDTLRIRAEIDSLLRAHGTDTAALYAAARRTAEDKELTAALYLHAIERFESITHADTLHGTSNDNAESPASAGREP